MVDSLRPSLPARLFALRISDLAMAAYLCLAILLGAILASAEFLHWFLLPIFGCGILIGADAVAWIRRRVDIFDPIGVLGLYGFYFFFLAPLLHVGWDQYTLFKVTPPFDWRNWLGAMALLNLLGLLLYRLARWLTALTADRPRRLLAWRLQGWRYTIVMGAAWALAALLLVRLFASFGGLAGYIASANNSSNWDGLGYTVAIAESLPILTFMAFVVFAANRAQLKRWPVLLLVLVGIVALTLFARGLRGNRSDLIWPLFWILGLFHFNLRPLSRKWIYLGLPLFLLFMYAYQFFDHFGPAGLGQITRPAAHEELAEQTGYSFQAVILGDLGRSDVQAFLLYRLAQPENDYHYAWGRTYVSGVSRMIPQSIMARPPNKVKEGTEAQYGWGTWVPISNSSSKVYGLAGEAMLNFTPWAVPIAFIGLGIYVGSLRHLLATLQPGDSRWLLAPFLVNLAIILLIADTDNVVWFVAKDGGLAMLVTVAASAITVRR